ncbi:response regulator [Emticicia aquatilis]|nr:response regulator [Emticicia aquatilis]
MKTNKLCFKLILFLLCQIGYVVYAQEINLQSTQKFPINISTSVEVFRDSSAKLTLEQVKQKPFLKSPKDHFIFPYSDDVFWVRFTLKNNLPTNKNWFFVWSNPLVEQLDFYISDSTQKNFSHTQQKLITSKRDKALIDQDPRFPFELNPHQTKIVYVKLSSKRGHYCSLYIHTNDSFYQTRINDYSRQSFSNGLVFFRLFLVLILSIFIIRDIAFKLYSFHTVLKTLAYWGLMNILGPIISDNPDIAKKIDFICYNSITMGSALFILFTLARKKLPIWHTYIIYSVIFFTLFVDTMVCITYQWYWLKAGLYTIILSSLYFIGLYAYCIIKQIPISKYYAIPFILGLISYFLINVRLLGWIEFKPLFDIATLLFVAEIFVFVFFLGRIFKVEERNKLIAEQKLTFNIEQNNRLKELDNLKTTFFTNISHELRTPLTLITGPFQQLAEKYPSERLIPLIQRNTDRLLTLINQLLDISKLEAGQMRPEISEQNITKYFRTLTSSFTSLAESRGIKFEIEFDKKDTYGYIDKDKTDKIITNLLSNAFKFTPIDGSVKISTKFDTSEQLMIVEVSDTGIGIEPEKLSKIFDRFFQVDDSHNRRFEGTGIGLALVKELVEVLKGQITVKSQKNIGTTFTTKLPIDFATWKEYIIENADNLISEKTNFTNNNSEKINSAGGTCIENDNILLVVDDNEDIRTYIRSIFEKEYKIVEAVNGKDGVEKARTQIPDIIISDLMMPEMDGFEFCKILKADEKTSHIPIVMLTAKANVESRIEGFQLGADDYLTKPFNSHEMQARVKNLLVIREKLKKYYQQSEKTEVIEAEIKINLIDERFIQKVRETIDANLANSQFSIEQLADEVSLSTTQLRRKIKALSNLTIVEFIRLYRLEKAAHLLSQNAGNVSEIAFNVGFDSLSYFAKVFQETYGVLPSDYRSVTVK